MKSLLNLLKSDFSAQVVAGLVLLLLLYPFIYGFPLSFIGYDTLGYYLYLPQLFIEGDLALSNTDAVHEAISHYNSSHVFYQAHYVESTGNHVIQYSAGLALVFAPFFLIGHLFAWILGYQMDGYSLPYAWAMIICGYFYTVVGLIFLRKLLIKLFSPKIAGWTIVLIVLGTNYFNIQTHSLGLTHIYLFAFYAALIYYTIRWHENFKLVHAVLIGVLIGWMVLIRPTEIFAAFIPLLWGVYNRQSLISKWHLIVKNGRSILLLIGYATAIIFIQMLYWKHVTGQFVYYSYRNPGEGFNLDHPHLMEFLFSYRKGWFLYTPIMLLAFFGPFVNTVNRQKWIVPFVLLSAVTIYVSSSWSAWWYAASFSQRTMVQLYPFLAIGIAALLTWLSQKRNLLIPSSIVIAILLCLNLFQSWQFMKGILPPDRITKDFYWAIFGKTSIPAETFDLLSIDRSTAVFNQNRYDPFWSKNLEGLPSEVQHLKGDDEWGEGIKIPFEETCDSDHCWYEIEFDAFVPKDNDSLETQLICHLTHVDDPYGYTSFPLGHHPDFKFDEWVHYSFMWLSPHPRLREDRFITFLWGRKQELFFKNFKVTSYVEKDKR